MEEDAESAEVSCKAVSEARLTERNERCFAALYLHRFQWNFLKSFRFSETKLTAKGGGESGGGQQQPADQMSGQERPGRRQFLNFPPLHSRLASHDCGVVERFDSAARTSLSNPGKCRNAQTDTVEVITEE